MNKQKQAGFSALESLGFLALIAGIVAIAWPSIKEVQAKEKESLKLDALVQIETSKTQFDGGARPADRRAFDDAGDAERFKILMPSMQVTDDTAFATKFGLAKIKVNRLGQNAEVE